MISDGTEALLGSLSADRERFMAWRTIDGVTFDPLGPFNELQTLVRGVLAPTYLLDYLRFFVLFEDDADTPGGLVKKIAGYHQFHAVRCHRAGDRGVSHRWADQPARQGWRGGTRRAAAKASP